MGTLWDQQDRSSSGEEEAFSIIEETTKDPANMLKMACVRWSRVFHRLTFMVLQARYQRVLSYWEQQTLDLDPKHQDYQSTSPQKPRKERRDDLLGVGPQIAPSKTRLYPVPRSTCSHESTSGQTYLTAQGYQEVDKKTKRRATKYAWLCQSCGARWQRIHASPPEGEEPQQKNKPLRPIFTPSSGVRVTVKREQPDSNRPVQPPNPTMDPSQAQGNPLAQAVVPGPSQGPAEIFHLSDDDAMKGI